ncbi:biliverdin-producing heme oxygenase [Rhizobium sp. PL01]|uniref:biliverdin-producing heme oxygenase n=1 Tax=Rhizobium sp. PL01 TaxID=3085631 RepID=UPI002980E00A|nr:biliverdin-producing heme oxygenase [Rhizobium sp. PL01]MDW5317164.1 biliverdin-producing heme oxygenase [Rhizobium sp. PL01]
MISSRRMFLRDRSADAHASRDRLVGPLDTRGAYRRYVAGIAAFRLPLEAKLAPVVWSQVFAGYAFQPLGNLLAEDMIDLDLTAIRTESSDAGPMALEELVGTLYVVEGSALGSILLFRRAEALGMAATFGARHLAAQSMPGDQWRSYLTLLEARPLDMELVLEFVTATFQSAETAFASLEAN